MNLKYIYTPGAGKMPKYLAGRKDQIEIALSAFEALLAGEVPTCIAYSGYRGVGKTVLLNRLQETAEEKGITCYHIEVREDGSLIPRLLSHCRDFLNNNSGMEKLRNLFQKGAGALKSLEIGFSPKKGEFSLSAGNGKAARMVDFSQSLENLFEAIGPIAKAKKQPLCFFIDEFQYADPNEMDAFLGALHRLSQLSYPVIAILAGTPEMISKMYDKKTYVERLFVFPDLMLLTLSDVSDALNIPGEKAGLSYDKDAVKAIYDVTGGYPYFVQVYGQILCSSLGEEDMPLTITGPIAEKHYDTYLKQLDNNFYKIRLNNRSLLEQEFLFAMASLSLPCQTSEVARLLNKTPKQIAPTLAKLKSKGIIANDKGLSFTVPGFSDYLKRIQNRNSETS
ncbi:MAG: ATP-binding protein [Lachnospiraceae bacterium]|nr:ATP-binding protein [Lachnospiraceae bacterium]